MSCWRSGSLCGEFGPGTGTELGLVLEILVGVLNSMKMKLLESDPIQNISTNRTRSEQNSDSGSNIPITVIRFSCFHETEPNRTLTVWALTDN